MSAEAAETEVQAETQMDFLSYLDTQRSRVDEYLRSCFDEHLNRVEEAAAYSLFLKSKRIRPILALEVCKAFSGDDEAAWPAAAAIEMLHTYSLVHDDLPCMDDDDLRRGMPTNHKKFGEATAVLAGDGLLTKAFEVLSSAGSAEASTRVAWVYELSKAAGLQGMVLGQELDIQSDHGGSLDGLKDLHRKKTGALIVASAAMGAIAAGAEGQQISQIRKFADLLGLAFQIHDDVLDVEGGEELGKPSGSDEKNDKLTYVSLMGLESAKSAGLEAYESSISALQAIGFSRPHRLEELARFVVKRRS